MWWVIFAVGAALSWGMYGTALFKGQTQLGNPFKALLCVGVAYFLIGVLVPVGTLARQGGVSGFNAGGILATSRVTWCARRVCIIYAFGPADCQLRYAARIRRSARCERAGVDGHASA
jgi:hypothetical protein